MNFERIINLLFDDSVIEECKEKKKFLTDITKLPIEDIIDFFIIKADKKLQNGSLSFVSYINIMLLISKMNILNYDTIESLKERLKWLKNMGLDDVNINLKKSHKEILDTFDNLNIVLNKAKIDYYHTSGMLSYLLTDNSLMRYHHDLDIFINDNDIDKLQETIKDTNFKYYIYLGKRTENTNRKTVKIVDKKNNIIISVFLFERQPNNAIIINDYYLDENSDLFATQDYNSPRCVELSLSDKYFQHNNIPFKSITIEALYNCKKGKGLKHQFDCKILEPFVDFEKEKEIDAEIRPLSKPFKVNDNSIKKMLLELPRMSSTDLLND